MSRRVQPTFEGPRYYRGYARVGDLDFEFQTYQSMQEAAGELQYWVASLTDANLAAGVSAEVRDLGSGETWPIAIPPRPAAIRTEPSVML